MRGVYKAAGIIGLISAYVISTVSGIGCSNNEISKPDIQVQTIPLSEKVLNLSNDIFFGYYGSHIHSGALSIGKDQNGANRYAVIMGSKEEGFKGLTIWVYSNLNPEVQAEVDEYLLNRRYRSAEEVLNKTKGAMIRFHDAYANGLNTDINDMLVTRNEKGEYAEAKVGELSEDGLRNVNELYDSVLKAIEPVLEKEWKAREERIAKIDQETKEKIAAMTLDQRIEDAMQNLAELRY